MFNQPNKPKSKLKKNNKDVICLTSNKKRIKSVTLLFSNSRKDNYNKVVELISGLLPDNLGTIKIKCVPAEKQEILKY